MTGGPARLLLLVIIPFVSFELLLSPHFPTTHALVDDWANHAHRFTIFLIGYFAAKNMTFWRSVGRAFPAAAVLVVVLAVTGVLIELYEDALAQTFLGRIPYILYWRGDNHIRYSIRLVIYRFSAGCCTAISQQPVAGADISHQRGLLLLYPPSDDHHCRRILSDKVTVGRLGRIDAGHVDYDRGMCRGL
ncbi:MAG: hypothetical protein GXP04_15165 [Alphaproteobacteria bacterium]|nr:hypothetical protein [Alphaproteobacteria bacterium]